MNKLTMELKKVKNEVKMIRSGKQETFDESVITRRGIEDYNAMHEVKTGRRKELQNVLFDFKKNAPLNQSFIADKEALKKRAKEIR